MDKKNEEILTNRDRFIDLVFILAKMYRRSGGTDTAVPAEGYRQSGTGYRRSQAGKCEFTRLGLDPTHTLPS